MAKAKTAVAAPEPPEDDDQTGSVSPLWRPRLQVVSIKGDRANIILHDVRLAFVAISAPRSFQDGKEPSYQLIALAQKSLRDKWRKELAAIAHQIIAASSHPQPIKQQAYKTATTWNESASLIRDGETFVSSKTGEVYDGFSGCIAISARTGSKPNADGTFSPKVPFPIVDAKNRPIPADQIDDRIYSGAIASVSLTLQPYGKVGGNAPGVTRYLSGVQAIGDAPRLGASNPFEARDDVADAHAAATFGGGDFGGDSEEGEEAGGAF